MADFTRVWDENFPPDTQPANQLGSDLRNFRTDARQRFTLSGNDADKPTNGTVNETGLLYFAVDTTKIYRWSGAAWIDITGLMFGTVRKFQNNVPVVTNSVIDGLTINIPANTLSTGNILSINSIVSCGSGFGADAVETMFNGVQIGGINIPGFSDSVIISRPVIFILSNVLAIVSIMTMTNGGGVNAGSSIQIGIDVTTDMILKTRAVQSSGASITHSVLSAVMN